MSMVIGLHNIVDKKGQYRNLKVFKIKVERFKVSKKFITLERVKYFLRPLLLTHQEF